MLKMSVSKARGSEAPGTYIWVREEAERLRTPLAVFFSILLRYAGDCHSTAKADP